MHEPIVNHVEDYLTRSDSTSLPADFTAHLVSCAECRQELAAMETHARFVRVLKPEETVDPARGFYARLIERIEAQRPVSMWSIFLQPFGQRLAFASLALALLMGVYLISTEPGMDSGAAVAIQQTAVPGAMLPGEDQPGLVIGANIHGSNEDQDRGAVLVNLATYHEQ
jgi:hypothetical protein